MSRPLRLPAGLLPDFLVPSICVRQTATIAPSSKTATPTSKNKEEQHKWPTSLLNVSPLSLKQELDELRQVIQPTKKGHTPFPSLSPYPNNRRPPAPAVFTGEGQVHEAVSKLRREITKKDIHTILETSIEVLSLDPAALPSQDRQNLSDFLSGFLRDAPLSATRSSAESIAVKLCGRRSWAINSALRYHLNRGDATTVLELYNCIIEVASPVFVTSPEVPELHAKRHWLEGKLPMMIMPNSEAAVLYAIAAHAINENYIEALKTAMMVTPAVLLPRRVKSWMEHAFDQELRAAGLDGLFYQYVIRIWLSRLFHNGFERQMRALAAVRPDDGGLKDINDLYTLTKQGIQEGWLVLEHGGKYADSAEAMDEEVKRMGEVHEPELEPFSVLSKEPGSQEEIPPEFPTIQAKHWIYFLKWYFSIDLQAREKPLQVWEDALEMGVRPTPWMWSTLIDGYGRMGLMDTVYSIFERMRASKTRPDISSMIALMGALFRVQTEESIRSAMDIFQQIIKQAGPAETWGHTTFVPNALLVVKAYNCVLDGLVRNRSTSRALEIFENMRRKGPLPDVATYNILIQQYGRMKGTRKELAKMLRALHEEKGRLKPDAYTFSIILTALRRHGMAGALGLILNSMKEFGVEPNIRVMSSLIETVFERWEKDTWQEALSILEEMEREKRGTMKPNVIIYTQFITQLSRLRRETLIEEQEAREWANNIIERMIRQACRPNNITYHSLMVLYLTFRGREAAENAVRWLVKIQEEAGGAKFDDWLVLIRGLVERGDVDVAARAVRYMRQVGFQPTDWFAHQINRIPAINVY
jgi:pentatricopeptide repeat protein